MKSVIISETLEQQKTEYPILMYWNGHKPDPKFVVLFHDYENGVVLATGEDPNYKVGQAAYGLAIDEFAVFTGTLNLSNN